MNIALSAAGIFSWMNAPALSSKQIDALKYLAALLMFLDHASLLPQVPAQTALAAYYLSRAVFPIFAFVMVYHYLYHTRDKLKYLLRVFIVALIAQGPYLQLQAMNPGAHIWDTGNILFSLALGLVVLMLLEWVQKFPDVPFFQHRKHQNILPAKWFVVTFGSLGIFVVSLFVEYLFFGSMMMAAFYFWIKSPSKESANAAVFFTFLLNIVPGFLPALATLSFFLIMGLIGGARGRGLKLFPPAGRWFFYFFYPAHLALIVIIDLLHNP